MDGHRRPVRIHRVRNTAPIKAENHGAMQRVVEYNKCYICCCSWGGKLSQASSSLSSLYPFMSLLLPCTQVPHTELELGDYDVFMCRCSTKWCKKIKKKARIVRIGTYYCTSFTLGLGKLCHTIFYRNITNIKPFLRPILRTKINKCGVYYIRSDPVPAKQCSGSVTIFSVPVPAF